MSSDKLISSRRLWLFRAVAGVGSLGISGGAGWVCWHNRSAFVPSACERTSRAFDAAWQALPPSSKVLLDAAGYSRQERLVLPANFDGSMVISGKVMETTGGRGYRFRPSRRNLWVLPQGLSCQVLVPDTPPVRDALEQGHIHVSSEEEINSLGCRGPEFEEPRFYDYRVLVLGDSFTEGILVQQADTFCTRLEARLSELTGRTTLVANSGVVGYSTEQEYHTMLELTPRLRPHIVLLCFFANDVHQSHEEVVGIRAAGDWDSARRWLERCNDYCLANAIKFVVAAVTDRSQMASRATRSRYQHRLESITTPLGIYLIDPDERFLAHRRQQLWLQGDAHFAPQGHALFAEALAEHLQQWTQ